MDALGNSHSGSLEVDNLGTTANAPGGWSSLGAWQCVPVSAGSKVVTAVQAYLPSGQADGWAGFVLQFFYASDCTGPDSGRDFVSGQDLTAGGWQTLLGTMPEVPIGITSMAVRLLATKAPSQPELRAEFDNILVIEE